jgi:hypothetical protein
MSLISDPPHYYKNKEGSEGVCMYILCSKCPYVYLWSTLGEEVCLLKAVNYRAVLELTACDTENSVSIYCYTNGHCCLLKPFLKSTLLKGFGGGYSCIIEHMMLSSRSSVSHMHLICYLIAQISFCLL